MLSGNIPWSIKRISGDSKYKTLVICMRNSLYSTVIDHLVSFYNKNLWWSVLLDVGIRFCIVHYLPKPYLFHKTFFFNSALYYFFCKLDLINKFINNIFNFDKQKLLFNNMFVFYAMHIFGGPNLWFLNFGDIGQTME